MLTAPLSGHQVMINGYALWPPPSFVRGCDPLSARNRSPRGDARSAVRTNDLDGHQSAELLRDPSRSRSVAEGRAPAAPDPLWSVNRSRMTASTASRTGRSVRSAINSTDPPRLPVIHTIWQDLQHRGPALIGRAGPSFIAVPSRRGARRRERPVTGSQTRLPQQPHNVRRR